MLRHLFASLACVAAFSTAQALTPHHRTDTVMIPERVVAVTGDAAKGHDLIAILYDRRDLHFSEPNAPRFLFLDRDGEVLLGIGGYVKGTMSYDFDGAIDNGSEFTTFDIPVPSDPGLRNRLAGNINHSRLFLRLVGRSERFGSYEGFISTSFAGGASGNQLKLKKAYMRLGNIIGGYYTSTFVDASAGTPVVNDQSPSGEATGTNVGIFYNPLLSKHIKIGVSLEIPSASYRTNADVTAISQRCPDIPVYIQYGWDNHNSHIRLSGLYRNLSYRDMTVGKNRFVTGWAVQLSGTGILTDDLTAYWQGSTGRGYGRYVNDLEGNGYDLVPSATVKGKMVAPHMADFEVGMQYTFTPEVSATACYSESHVIRQYGVADNGYKYGRYMAITCWYDPVPDLNLGIEYLYGSRKDFNTLSSHANRIEAMVKYNF